MKCDPREIMDLLSVPDPLENIKARPDIFGEVIALMDGVQHPRFHAEGDVWQHTQLVIKNIVQNKFHDWVDVLAALFHDAGKKKALEENEGKHMGGHENHSVEIFRDWAFFNGMDSMFPEAVEAIVWAIQNHMKAHRLAEVHGTYDIMVIVTNRWFPRLSRLASADSMSDLDDNGNPTSSFADVLACPSVARWVGESAPWPIVSRLDLNEAGIPPYLRDKGVEVAYKMQVNSGKLKREHLVNAVVGDRLFRKARIEYLAQRKKETGA